MALLNSKFTMEEEGVVAVPTPVDIFDVAAVDDATHDISDICQDLSDGQVALGEVLSHEDDLQDAIDNSPEEIDDEDVAVAMEAFAFCAAKAGLDYKSVKTPKAKQESGVKVSSSPISKLKEVKNKFTALRVKMEEAIEEQSSGNILEYIKTLDSKLPGWNRQRCEELHELISEFDHDDNATVEVIPDRVLKSLATTLKATSIGCFALLANRTKEGDIGVLINDFVRNNMTLASQYKILLKELKDKDFNPEKLHDFQCSYMDVLKSHPECEDFVKIPAVGPCDPDGVDVIGVTNEGEIKYTKLHCSQSDLVSGINNICVNFAQRMDKKTVGTLKEELHKFLDGAKDLDLSLADDDSVVGEIEDTEIESHDAAKIVHILAIFTGKVASTTKRAFDAQTLVVNDLVHLAHTNDAIGEEVKEVKVKEEA